mgnify:CR=1 FL=1
MLITKIKYFLIRLELHGILDSDRSFAYSTLKSFLLNDKIDQEFTYKGKQYSLPSGMYCKECNFSLTISDIEISLLKAINSTFEDSQLSHYKTKNPEDMFEYIITDPSHINFFIKS